MFFSNSIFSQDVIKLCNIDTCLKRTQLVSMICEKLDSCDEVILNINKEYCKCNCSSTDINNRTEYSKINRPNSIIAIGNKSKWVSDTMLIRNKERVIEEDYLSNVALLEFSNGLKALVQYNHLIEDSNGKFIRTDEIELGTKVNFLNFTEIKLINRYYGEYTGMTYFITPKNTTYWLERINDLIPNSNDNSITLDTIRNSNSITLDNGVFQSYNNISNLCGPGIKLHHTTYNKTHKKLKTSCALEEKKNLISFINSAIPEVHIDYFLGSNIDNACARIINSRKEVYIYGGLLCNASINELKIVIAHEIGHLNAQTSDTYPPGPIEWAACEKQAWYWGLMVTMRRIYCNKDAIKSIYYGAVDRYNRYNSDINNPDHPDGSVPLYTCRETVKTDDLIDIALHCIKLIGSL